VVNLAETVKMDNIGRILIPKSIRQKLDSNEFEVHYVNDKLELIPVRHPVELFGTLKKTNRKKLDSIHGEDHEFAS